MENKKQLMITAVVVIAIVAVGMVAIPSLSQKVFADHDSKSKRYVSEDGSGDRTIACTKDTGGCKNLNINKAAKEFCESDSGQRCKQSK